LAEDSARHVGRPVTEFAWASTEDPLDTVDHGYRRHPIALGVAKRLVDEIETRGMAAIADRSDDPHHKTSDLAAEETVSADR